MFHVVCILIFALFSFTDSAHDNFIVIRTRNGDIRGVESITDSNTTFYTFRGIRYAQPPVGDLRFHAPLPAANWTGVYDATEHGNECLQNKGDSIVGEEDCLFLNVYTTKIPSDNSITDLLPVLVWIHGGGFEEGSGNLNLHGADRFLDKDLLVVSINYRLGIFGFLSTKDDVIPGNYGLKDQILALEWIQQNIASFGGDPKQVTIFGQSAGAACVHYLRQSKRARNLFHRSIANSGNSVVTWAISPNARELAFTTGLNNGIQASNSTSLLEELRRIEATKLKRSTYLPSSLTMILNLFNGIPFAPTLEESSEEAVYTKYSYEAQKNGDCNKGPVLQGFNSLEMNNLYEESMSWYEKLLLEYFNRVPSRIVPWGMNANITDRKIVGQNIKSYYFHNESILKGPYLNYYVSDNAFVRGIIKSSQLLSHHSNVYLYRFSFTGGALHSNNTPDTVSHTEELQFLWLEPKVVQHTPEARLTVERMIQMWSNFAKTGNPTPKISEAVNVTWPLANATGYNSVHYLDIGDELVPAVNPQQDQMKFWEEQYSQYGNPPYNTY